MKRHLLVVDEDKTMVHIFSTAFTTQDSPYKCTCAEGVFHARQMIEFLRPDVIFIRLDKEVMRALEFLLSLKKNKKFSQIKTIAYSDDVEYYKLVSKAYGADMVVSSPTDVDSIYRTLAAVMDHKVMI
jgi:CheY-like chemotaxis protein